jgi:hypothetical protein
MQQNEWKRELEPSQPVHRPWIELMINSDVQWQPPLLHCHEGPNAGPCMGPIQYIKDVIRTATNLLAVFISTLPLTFFSKVAEMTEKYLYKDWVVEQRSSSGRHNFQIDLAINLMKYDIKLTPTERKKVQNLIIGVSHL